jgi:hypothetical protein
MIKILLALILLSPPIESIPNTAPAARKSKLTIKKVSLEKLFALCPVVAERHVMPQTIYNPTTTHIVKIENCLEAKTLLVVGWYGSNSALEKTFAKLVALHYASYMSKLKKKKYSIKYVGSKSKAQNMSALKGDISRAWFSFFKLRH